jgi:phosphatidylserine/phosphatidylglycerophosphate/cardiolipin synthase-like enzyme
VDPNFSKKDKDIFLQPVARKKKRSARECVSVCAHATDRFARGERMVFSTFCSLASSSSSVNVASPIDGKANNRKMSFSRHPNNHRQQKKRRSVLNDIRIATTVSASTSSSSPSSSPSILSPNVVGDANVETSVRDEGEREIRSSMIKTLAEELTTKNNNNNNNNTNNKKNNTKSAIKLVSGYLKSIENLIREIDDTNRGDEIQLSVYVFEHGNSTERVIESLSSACNRGVSVRVKVDGSAVSKFTRWCEQSTTLVEKLRELEKKRNNANEFELIESTIPTHAKYATFKRKNNGEYTGMLGGINIGDRFENWRDFTVLVQGQELVEALESSVSSNASSFTPSSLTSLSFNLFEKLRWPRGKEEAKKTEDVESTITKFVSNNPTGFCPLAWAFPRIKNFPGTFSVKKSFEDILNDRQFDDYTFSIAYLDSSGVAMIRKIIDRNANVTILMPCYPNVYHDANRKALAKLKKVHELIQLRSKTSAPRLSIKLLPEMLHAKAFVAKSTMNPDVGIASLGSCNMRQRSFGQFQELNIITRDENFREDLESELENIAFGSFDADDEDFLYAEPKASVEEFLG